MIQPLKRIGEEVQFKKFKGNYLYYAFGIVIGYFIVVIIILGLNLPSFIKMIIVGVISLFCKVLLGSFQKKSMEDYYFDTRKRCLNSTIHIKGEIVKSLPNDLKND